MSAIQQGRYDALLRRVADLKGQGSMVHDALGELFPVLDVENTPTELLYLMGTKVAQGAFQVTGDVGFFQRIQLFNPADSSFILTITDVTYAGAATATYNATPTNSILPDNQLGTTAFNDTRAGIAIPVGEIRTSAVAATPTAGRWQTRLLANVSLIESNPRGIIVLAPGAAYEVGLNKTNTIQNTGFRWRERLAEPSELNF